MKTKMSAQQTAEALRREILAGVSYGDQERREIETADENLEFDVRYFGDWMVPEDEEDDGDYDWKIPTPATVARLNAICKRHTLASGRECSWQNEGEKNWLRFYVAR